MKPGEALEMYVYETNQQVFDIVSRHLLLQGEKCMGADGYCRYKDMQGKSCAIGCLIPDEVYDPVLEGHNIGKIFETVRMFGTPQEPIENEKELYRMERFREVTALFSGEASDSGFLRGLQAVHRYTPDHWVEILQRIGESYGLTLPHSI